MADQEPDIKREAAEEQQAVYKGLFAPMKAWFNETKSNEETYGEFPMFWQELGEWEHFKSVQRAYLASQEVQKNEVGPAEDESNRKRLLVFSLEVGSADSRARRRKKRLTTRWAKENSILVPVPPNLSPMQQQTFILRMKLEDINRRVLTSNQDAKALENDPDRSPSPKPQYDHTGKRTNTRGLRLKAKLLKKRDVLIEELLAINPYFNLPPDVAREKLRRKLYIPLKEFPNYNFIGLIIGPRGNTQKRMERETNCKIAIRGRGSSKPGRRNGGSQEDDNDDLHVLIEGTTPADVERAVQVVGELLKPVDDGLNMHKQRQLRELALINGTLRTEENICHICAEEGHRQFECPKRTSNFKAANVKCSICGDSSHVTADCKSEGKSKNEEAIDTAYQNFMAELGSRGSGGGGGGGGAAADGSKAEGGDGEELPLAPTPAKPAGVMPPAGMAMPSPSMLMAGMMGMGMAVPAGSASMLPPPPPTMGAIPPPPPPPM